MNYVTFKEYSHKTGRSVASIYRDAEKGLIKTTLINGKKHIIIDKNLNFLDLEEAHSSSVSSSNTNPIKEGVLVEDLTNIKYEVEIFKNTITTIEELANRIEQAKDETIQNLKDEIEKNEGSLSQLNDLFKSISEENIALRMEVSQKNSQIVYLEKKIEEINSGAEKSENFISSLRGENENKEKLIKEFELKVHEDKLMISSIQHEVNEINAKKETLLFELESSERKYNELKSDYEKVRKNLEEKDEELSQLKNQIFEINCKYESAQRDLASRVQAEDDLGEKENAIKTLTLENINYRDEKGQLELKVEEKNIEIKQNNHKIGLLQEQIQLLERELKNHVDKKNFFSFTKKL